MITIPYTDSNISKVGRFLPDSSGIQSGWQGSQLRFKVQGTTQIVLTTYCYDPIIESAQWLGIGANIDQGDTVVLPLETDAESFTGTRSVTLTLPDTGLHTIILKLADKAPWYMWDESTIIRLTQMQIDDGGEILPWVQTGPTKLMIVGDSWSASWLDWPRLLPSNIYSIYPVAYGGATAADLDARFHYNKQGLVETDPDVDAVLVIPGVNDYNAGVSGSSFQSSVLSLVDKICATQATAKIYLLQAPRNIGAGKNYDQYGTNLQAIAAMRSNVYYIPTSGVWSSLSWVDPNHLDFASRQTYATFIAAALTVSGNLGTLALTGTSVLVLGTTSGTASPAQNGDLSTLSLNATSTLTMGILAGLSGNTIRAPSGSGLVLRGIDGHIITLNFLQ